MSGRLMLRPTSVASSVPGPFDTRRHLQQSNRHANKHQVNESAHFASTTDSSPSATDRFGKYFSHRANRVCSLRSAGVA
jgi:hypothetical protein